MPDSHDTGGEAEACPDQPPSSRRSALRRRALLAAALPAFFSRLAEAETQTPVAPRQLASVPMPGTDEAASFAPPQGVTPRALRFPADHGAHPDTRIEWWYVTGWLRAGPARDAAAAPTASSQPQFGFQATFFRDRTGVALHSASRFAARQLVFAHAALTDLSATGENASSGFQHDQRIAREGFALASTPLAGGTQVAQLHDWTLARAAASPDGGTSLTIALRSDRFGLDLALRGTQPLLLQGDAGYSRKGPLPAQASHYYSEPQLAVEGRVERAGKPALEVVGRAWLDHEWSETLMPPEATGWDWVGFNLLDGSAFTAFRVRRADGSALWAGGSFRDAAGRLRIFDATELAFTPTRLWKSPRSGTAYPVEWTITTPAGRFEVAALRDDQELDSRTSTGAIYWEGLSALRQEGHVVGWGYLELTGYADRLRL